MVVLLLLNDSPAYRFAKHIGVHLGGGSSASHEWRVVMTSWAFLVQLIEEKLTACHESNGLLDQPHFTSSMLDVGCHAELTHVPLSNANRWMPQELGHARQLP